MSDQGHPRGAVQIRLGEGTPAAERPVANGQVARRNAVDRPVPVEVPVHDLHDVAFRPPGFGHQRNPLLDVQGIGHRQCDRPALSAPHPAHRRRSGPDDDDVRADRRDLGLNRPFGAFSDADHGNNRGHADDDAQHREPRAKSIAPENPQRRHDREPDECRHLHPDRLRPAFGGSIAQHLSVLDDDFTMRVGRHIDLMRDQDDRDPIPIEPLKNGHDFLT